VLNHPGYFPGDGQKICLSIGTAINLNKTEIERLFVDFIPTVIPAKQV
jgi:hypothetical protein